jgi:hypothetical protein
MRRSAKLGLTAMTAASLLSLAVTTASARNLQTSEFSYRIWWASWELVSSVATVRCRVTLEGSFHARTFVKSSGSLVGAITRAIAGHPCTGGESWIDNGTEAEPLGTAPNRLPWHDIYTGFTGSLPNITNVTFALGRLSWVIRVAALGLTCQGRYGRLEDTLTVNASREAGGGITSLSLREGANRVSLVEQLGPNAICPGTAAFTGSSGPAIELSTGVTLKYFLI